jgi:hypothetical protein
LPRQLNGTSGTGVSVLFDAFFLVRRQFAVVVKRDEF